jgi:hypothetical protein
MLTWWTWLPVCSIDTVITIITISTRNPLGTSGPCAQHSTAQHGTVQKAKHAAQHGKVRYSTWSGTAWEVKGLAQPIFQDV